MHRPTSAEPYPKVFATFAELKQLGGVFGFAECIELLPDYTVVCIDEFELDDPGNTTLVSRMLLPASQPAASARAAVRRASRHASGATLDDFDALCAHLATVHPSRYLTLIEGVTGVFLTGVHGIDDQNGAPRLPALTADVET